MSFVLLDDQIAGHPKVLRAGAEAAWLWAVSIAYCSRQLTDGRVPSDALPTLGKFRTSTTKLAATLVEARLFEVDGDDGFRVHDYLQHNDDRATVLKRRAKAAAKKAEQRAAKEARLASVSTPDAPHPALTTGEAVHDVSHGDMPGTASSSRGRVPIPIPIPTPLPTASESEAVDAPALPVVVPFDDDHGAIPTRRRNPAMAWEGRREGLGVPIALHRDFLSRMGTPDERALWAWYDATEREWHGKAIGDTCWQFWNKRFTEWQGATPRAAATPSADAPSKYGADVVAAMTAQQRAQKERAS